MIFTILGILRGMMLSTSNAVEVGHLINSDGIKNYYVCIQLHCIRCDVLLRKEYLAAIVRARAHLIHA